MEIFILIAFITFIWLTSNEIWNKTFVFKDETAQIEVSNAKEEQIDPELMSTAYFAENKFLDSIYDKDMQVAGSTDDLSYVVQKSNQVYDDYVNNLVSYVWRDDLTNDKTDLAYQVYYNSSSMGKYDVHNISNFVDTHRFTYELPVENGTDWLNNTFSIISGNEMKQFEKPDDNF